MTMETWRKVWREGAAPCLSDAALSALAGGLERDDPALMQGCTTNPPPLKCVEDWDCQGADPFGYAGWKGESKTTVGEVEEFFAKLCFDTDDRMGEPAACRWLLNWIDNTPRVEMRPELLAEVRLALSQRKPEGES